MTSTKSTDKAIILKADTRIGRMLFDLRGLDDDWLIDVGFNHG